MKKATLSSNIICERGENEVKSNGLDRKIILLKRRAHTFRVGVYLIMIIGWSFPHNLSIRSNLSGTCAAEI